MTEYKSDRIIGGDVRTVIVDETGKIVNRNPTKEELRCLEEELYISRRCKGANRYNHGDICPRCIEENEVTENSILYPGSARQEKDKDGKKTGRWICKNHWGRDYRKYNPNDTHNIIKSMRDCRKRNLKSDSDQAKGSKTQKLACILYGWEDLNKKYNNHNYPIDCIDKNGLLRQVKGRRYNSKNGFWGFGCLDREWHKCYENTIFFCFSEDGKRIEEIYKFPPEEIEGRISIGIYKNPSRGVQWYERYRVKDPEELRKANEIWQKIR